jgi:hypothetical protein
MGSTCNTYEAGYTLKILILVRRSERKVRFEDADLDERIILKRMLKK